MGEAFLVPTIGVNNLMDKALSWDALSAKQLREEVFDKHNWNGEAMANDILTLERHERATKYAKATMPVWAGVTAVSAYNLTRLGVLSGSGKGAALAGSVLGAYMTVSTLMG